MFTQARPSAQVELTTTDATTIVERVADGPRIEVVRLLICNTTGSAVTYRVFLDIDAAGSASYGTANALWYDVSLAANSTADILAQHQSGGIPLGRAGALGVQAGTANALTVTAFTVSEVTQSSEAIRG